MAYYDGHGNPVYISPSQIFNYTAGSSQVDGSNEILFYGTGKSEIDVYVNAGSSQINIFNDSSTGISQVGDMNEIPMLPNDIEALSIVLTGVYAIPPAPAPLPTPQSILEGSYVPASEMPARMVMIVPRVKAHSCVPGLPMISFSVGGRTEFRVRELLNAGRRDSNLVLDDGKDEVWKERVWKTTRLTIDWPGITSTGERMSCTMEDGKPCTRTYVARIVAQHIVRFFKGKALRWGPQMLTADTRHWKLKRIDYLEVRVLGICFYRKTWVPILAVDV